MTLVKIKLKLGRVNFKQFSKVNYLGCICRGPPGWILNTEMTRKLFKLLKEYLSFLVSAQINCSREERSHSYKLSCSYQVEGWEDKCFFKLKIPHEVSPPPSSLLTPDAIQAIMWLMTRGRPAKCLVWTSHHHTQHTSLSPAGAIISGLCCGENVSNLIRARCLEQTITKLCCHLGYLILWYQL